MTTTNSLFQLLCLCILVTVSTAFTAPTTPFGKTKRYAKLQLALSGDDSGSTATTSTMDSSDDDVEDLIIIDGKEPSDEWELDCYSRPVVVPGTGKKLWEVLVTDANGSFRFRKMLPSNQVNSKEVRATVEEVMEKMDSTPSMVRFFRGAMFNMLNIALSDLDVIGKPSRSTFALAQWLEERHRTVYPNMEGYKATMAGGGGPASFFNVRTPIKLPDALRGEQYAFVALPLAEFCEGGDITSDNVGVGRLCPIDPELVEQAGADTFVQGVVILTKRAKALASWLSGTEVYGLTADLRKRQLIMETDIDTAYLMARLNDFQRTEGAAFEEGKDQLGGLHFISVQENEDTDPEGFWLLREIPTGI